MATSPIYWPIDSFVSFVVEEIRTLPESNEIDAHGRSRSFMLKEPRINSSSWLRRMPDKSAQRVERPQGGPKGERSE